MILLHPGQEIDERLVGKIDLNETEPWVVEIEDHINGERHNDRKCGYVESDIVCFGVGQDIPGQQGTDQPENQEDGKKLISGYACVPQSHDWREKRDSKFGMRDISYPATRIPCTPEMNARGGEEVLFVCGFHRCVLSARDRFASSSQLFEKFLPRQRPHAGSDSLCPSSRLR